MKLHIVVITVALTAPMLAWGGQGNRAERARDAVETVDDVTDLSKDHRDRAQIVSISAEWNAAVETHDKAAEKAADARLAGWLVDELHEANQEVREARSEKRGSRRERNRSRNEAVNAGGANAKDVHDLRDDRRDLRDDRRDEVDAQIDRARLHEVVDELKGMQPRFETGDASVSDYARKRTLLAELVQSANAEIRDERREMREDNRERREDRRERREDSHGGY